MFRHCVSLRFLTLVVTMAVCDDHNRRKTIQQYVVVYCQTEEIYAKENTRSNHARMHRQIRTRSRHRLLFQIEYKWAANTCRECRQKGNNNRLYIVTRQLTTMQMATTLNHKQNFRSGFTAVEMISGATLSGCSQLSVFCCSWSPLASSLRIISREWSATLATTQPDMVQKQLAAECWSASNRRWWSLDRQPVSSILVQMIWCVMTQTRQSSKFILKIVIGITMWKICRYQLSQK